MGFVRGVFLLNFYPRSPCGERHYFSGVMRQNPGISIHALLAESDFSAGREYDTEG